MSRQVELVGKDSTGAFRTVRTSTDGTLQISGATTTSSTYTQIEGSTPADVADNGDNPIKIGGIARTANPTAVANGDRVSASFDDLGRQLVTPYQVRDLVATGYSVLTLSQEATIISAVAGSYLDILSVSLANTSSVAVPVNIRNVATGNIIDRIVVPAGGSFMRTYPVPLPASDTGNAITAQVATADQSDSLVSVSAIAIISI